MNTTFDQFLINALWATASAVMLVYIVAFGPEAIEVLRSNELTRYTSLVSAISLIGLGLYLQFQERA